MQSNLCCKYSTNIYKVYMWIYWISVILQKEIRLVHAEVPLNLWTNNVKPFAEIKWINLEFKHLHPNRSLCKKFILYKKDMSIRGISIAGINGVSETHVLYDKRKTKKQMRNLNKKHLCSSDNKTKELDCLKTKTLSKR